MQATDDIAHSPKAPTARPELVGSIPWQLPSAEFMNLLSIYSRVFRGGDPQSDAVALDGNDGDGNIVADDELLPNLARENKHGFPSCRVRLGIHGDSC